MTDSSHVSSEFDGPRSAPKRILLVDDQPANLLALEAIFQDQAYDLVLAQSGEEALRLLLKDEFAVVLLDVQMQGLDGFETARLIRSKKSLRHTPIIFVTAHEANRLSMREAYSLGAVDYLVKPLEPIVLRAKVAGFVDLFQKREQIRWQAEQLRHNESRKFWERLADENARLRESEARKAAILETALDAIVTIDEHGIIVEFNPAAERTFGYSCSQALGQQLAELLIPPSMRERHYQGFRHYLASGEARILNQRIEMPALRADGSEFFVELAISPISPGGRLFFTAHLRDITERKRQEQRRAARVAITQILAEATSLTEAAPRILRAACDNLQWDVGALWQLDKDDSILRCVEVWHRPSVAAPNFEAITRQRTFMSGEGLPGRIWSSGVPAWIPDVVNDGNFPRAAVAAKEGLHAAFGFPILFGQHCFGVVEFFSHHIREPDADKLEMAGTIGGQIGQFIERKRAEAVARDVGRQLHIVTEGMAALVARCSDDLRYLWVSKPYAQWIGRPSQEIVGRQIVDILGPEAFEQLRPRFERVLAGHVVKYEEEVALGQLGRRCIAATYTPTRNASGSPDGWVAVVLDTTERRHMENALRQSEQRFVRFMEHLPGLAWIKDLQGRYLYANATALKVFRLSTDRMYGKTDWELFPRETAEQFFENDRKALASETGVQFIETLQHDDGTVHHSVVNKFPISGPEGNRSLVGGMAIDITDRLRAEESLRDADRRKNEFLATLAHELRNPLAPIRTGIELLRLAGGRSDVIDEARSMMDRQLRHLVRLVDDLLDISRISRGRLQIRRERVELGPVIRDAIESSSPLIESLGHELVVSVPTGRIYLNADPTRLAQVFANLLNNAAKYMERGGHMWLTAERRDEGVVVAVRDRGIGIPADNLPHVFESFSQSVPSLDRFRGGLGVGLRACGQI